MTIQLKRNFLNKDLSFMEPCKSIEKFPFVESGCKKKKSCSLDRFFYHAKEAQIAYEKLLVESREGALLTKDEAKTIDTVIKNGVKNGQSIYSSLARITRTKLISHQIPFTFTFIKD